MMAYEFVLVLEGVHAIDESVERALFEAGCDDALLASVDGRVTLEFDREGTSLVDAVLGAVRAVEGCGCGIRVVDVTPAHAKELSDLSAALRVRTVGDPAVKSLLRQ